VNKLEINHTVQIKEVQKCVGAAPTTATGPNPAILGPTFFSLQSISPNDKVAVASGMIDQR
jgi:hypothetical protein